MYRHKQICSGYMAKELQLNIDEKFIENVSINVDVKMELKSIGELN